MPDPAGTRSTKTRFSGNVAADRPLLDRMVAQRGLFTGPSPTVPDELYLSVERGNVERLRSSIRLAPHTLASTNTYFGRFPSSYWQRWTAVRDVEVTITVSGTGRLALMASDVEGDARTVAATRVLEPGKVTLRGAIDRFVDGGAHWVELESFGEEFSVEEMAWLVPSPERIRPVAAVICTYNRADECLATLRAISEDPAFLQQAGAVYVVDQGTDRVSGRAGFVQVADALGDRLSYIAQRNLGGAGGFTRGLFEATGVAGAEHSNVIFMDDDILCEPDTIARLNAFANRTVEPTIVGAQMLYLLHPNKLHVGAETADLQALAAGVAAENALAADDVTEEQQDVRVDAGYTGWWSCLIPAEIVASVGFPLPMFFQWDDIEYGFRARSAGFATVTLPGAGVWHADFGWKDWDDWHRYFNIRNALVTAALHSPFDGRRVASGLLAHLVRYLVSMQYGLAHTVIKAVEDFLTGPVIFADGGSAAAAEIRAERAAYGETVRHPASAVPGLRSGEAMIANCPPEPSLPRAILVKRFLSQALGRTDRAAVSIPAADARWYHVSRFDTAVVTDASQESVRVRRRDPVAARTLLVRGLKAVNRLRRNAPRLREQYRAALPGVTSREHWARLFEQS